MLESLFIRSYGQKIAKRCVQNFESCHIKNKILYPQHFKDKSTLENNIHRAKECWKIWEVLLLSENSVFIAHRMVFGNHSIAHSRTRSAPFKAKKTISFQILTSLNFWNVLENLVCFPVYAGLILQYTFCLWFTLKQFLVSVFIIECHEVGITSTCL